MSQVYYSPSAVQAYKEAADKTRELLGQISLSLSKSTYPPLSAGTGPIHWGHVGDLNEINHKLSNVLQFITNGEKK
jgi:hypothetical protein